MSVKEELLINNSNTLSTTAYLIYKTLKAAVTANDILKMPGGEDGDIAYANVISNLTADNLRKELVVGESKSTTHPLKG